MSFEHPANLLWLALLVPLVALAIEAAGRAGRRRLAFFGAQAARLAPGFSGARRIVRDGLLCGALALCVLALGKPVWGKWMREVSQRGVDIMVVLDTSRSMLADDLKPNRLERAKREVRALLDRLHGDRVGLVTFAGDARLVCPLTSDPDSYGRYLDDVDTWTNAVGGTAVGEGLEKALDAFAHADSTGPRVILLLTDGEDHASDPPPTEIAYKARAQGVPIHVVTFGTAAGSQIRVSDPRGGVDVVRDADGQPVVSKPDEDLARRIANISDGSYLSAETTPFPVDEIWEKRIALMEGATRASSLREEGVDRYQWALCAALALLGLRAVVRERSVA